MTRGGTKWDVSSMGEHALLATCGNRISEELVARVHRLRIWLLGKTVAGITDLVPAFASLLVKFDPNLVGEAELRLLLADGFKSVETATNDLPKTRAEHIIPVHYGSEYGPDLESVAAMHELSPDEVIRLHSLRFYTVAFLGFLPGFAYLGTLPKKVASPRLAEPRQRVAGGSVGLAGFQTGIYPFASPGGWQIIGKTAAEIWNPSREMPALFSPGDTVRFVPTQEHIEHSSARQISITPLHPVFEVVEAKGIATVQDLGRTGNAYIGVGEGGVFDRDSASRANSLMGNQAGAAVLEMVLGGPTLRALQNCTIALDGADFHCIAGTMPVPLRLSWFVRAGTILRFAPPIQARGARAYLAVNGGFDVPLVLGSASTSLLAGFGGYAGRALATGDILGVHKASRFPIERAGKNWPVKVDDISLREVKLRFVPFKGRQAALNSALEEFSTGSWELTVQSDRMGCRFRPTEGAPLPTREEELASFGVVPGAIQLPPGGLPVVLGVDCQTTGGYPLLGVIVEADLPLLAQLSPGATVSFVAVSIEEAREAKKKAEEACRASMTARN